MNEHLNLGIKLRKFNRICPITGYREESIKIGSPVIVQTDRGIEYGEIIACPRGFSRALSRDVKLKKVIRYATAEDVEKERQIGELEKKSLIQAQAKVLEHELQLKIIAIEFLFDASQAIVYHHVSEGAKALNLRDFSRDLAAVFSARVDLRQVSPRDEARLFGGVGPCGRSLCCSVWLDKPKHVTVKMVKEQGLAMSPTKTAGVCGRLMCCLEYEHGSKK